MSKLLDKSQIESQLTSLSSWSHKENRLHAKHIFENFMQAFSYMTEMALYSEKVNHHPNWSNVYKEVEIELFTHDAGGVTEKDIAWAQQSQKCIKRKL